MKLEIIVPEDEPVFGFTLGIFDGLHAGHIHFFNSCLEFCDSLVVGVLSDKWATKNKRTPLFKLSERLDAIEAFHECIACESLDVVDLMTKQNCRLFFHGNDWLENKQSFDKTLPESVRIKLAKEKITLILLPYFKPVSSFEILKRAKK